MADDKIEVPIEYDPIFGARAKKVLVQDAEELGEKSGQKFNEGFQDKTRSIGSGFKSVLKRNIELPTLNATKVFAVLGSAAAAALGGRALIRAAQTQQDAVQALNTSLRLAGTFSEEASQRFQDLAASIEQNSTVGDEVILQQAALARNFARSNEEAEKLTKAAIELSAATGISLDSAVKNLGKTFAGLTGELGESLPSLRTLSVEALKSGGALQFVIDRFGGAAAARLNTFSGAVESARNTFGSLLEELGFLIIKNPLVIKGINALKNGIVELIGFIKDNQSTLKNLATVGFVAIANGAAALAEGVLLAAEGLIKLDAAAKNIAGDPSLDDLKSRLETVNELISKEPDPNLKAAFEQQRDAILTAITATELQAAEEQQIIQNRIAALEGFRDKVKDIAADIEESTKRPVVPEIVIPERPPALPPLSPEDQQALDSLTLFGQKLDSVTVKAQKFALDWGKVTTQVKNAAIQGLGRGVAAGFTAVGAALVNGENALKAFGKAFAAAIGQAAVQLGTRFILEGVAISFSPFLGGPAVGGPLIAAGSALTLFGGALGAISSGAGAGAGTGGGVGAAAIGEQPIGESPLVDQVEEREAPATQVAVNINGDVFDSDETGTRIARILSDSFQKDGIVITNGSFA